MENKKCRVGFVGTQSVGKSTLTKALAELPQFQDFYIITERSKYLRDLGIPLNQMSTLYGQVTFMSERLGELQHDRLLTDRTIIDVLAFTSLSPLINETDKAMFEVLFSRSLKEYDYIFYIPIEFDLEDNGVRDTNSEFRYQIDEKIKYYLEWYKFRIKNLYTISGSMEERTQKVLNILGF